LLAINDPTRTAECVEFLRKIAKRNTAYIYRGYRVRRGRDHPFREATFSIWAPEEDTAVYYESFQPLALRGAPVPAGVEPEAFRALRRSWTANLGENILGIDRAANNTSVVFALIWRGWRLLFTGDAELRSWKTIAAHAPMRRVDFGKVGNRGSRNATPPDPILDRFLPPRRRGAKMRMALVSTCANTYSGVPDAASLGRYRLRCDEVLSTTEVDSGRFIEARFPSKGSEIQVLRD
jgi:hypothetical protein